MKRSGQIELVTAGSTASQARYSYNIVRIPPPSSFLSLDEVTAVGAAFPLSDVGIT